MNLSAPSPPGPSTLPPAVPSSTVTGQDVADGTPMDQAHTAHGGSRSPQLSWHGLPTGTRSFVVSCLDPDAPTPTGYRPWTVVDLPASTTLPAGAGDTRGSKLHAPAATPTVVAFNALVHTAARATLTPTLPR